MPIVIVGLGVWAWAALVTGGTATAAGGVWGTRWWYKRRAAAAAKAEAAAKIEADRQLTKELTEAFGKGGIEGLELALLEKKVATSDRHAQLLAAAWAKEVAAHPPAAAAAAAAAVVAEVPAPAPVVEVAHAPAPAPVRRRGAATAS